MKSMNADELRAALMDPKRREKAKKEYRAALKGLPRNELKNAVQDFAEGWDSAVTLLASLSLGVKA